MANLCRGNVAHFDVIASGFFQNQPMFSCKTQKGRNKVDILCVCVCKDVNINIDNGEKREADGVSVII